MKTYVKKDTCIGCGAGTVIAENIFEIGEDGLAEVKEELREEKDINTEIEIKEEENDNVIDAAESCPTGAIVANEE